MKLKSRKSEIFKRKYSLPPILFYYYFVLFKVTVRWIFNSEFNRICLLVILYKIAPQLMLWSWHQTERLKLIGSEEGAKFIYVVRVFCYMCLRQWKWSELRVQCGGCKISVKKASEGGGWFKTSQRFRWNTGSAVEISIV